MMLCQQIMPQGCSQTTATLRFVEAAVGTQEQACTVATYDHQLFILTFPPLPKVWGLDRGFCTSTIMCHSSCNSVALTADGTTIASGHFDGTLRFWDLRSGRLAHEVAGLHSQQITSVAAGLCTGEISNGNVATTTLCTSCKGISCIKLAVM